MDEKGRAQVYKNKAAVDLMGSGQDSDERARLPSLISYRYKLQTSDG